MPGTTATTFSLTSAMVLIGPPAGYGSHSTGRSAQSSGSPLTDAWFVDRGRWPCPIRSQASLSRKVRAPSRLEYVVGLIKQSYLKNKG